MSKPTEKRIDSGFAKKAAKDAQIQAKVKDVLQQKGVLTQGNAIALDANTSLAQSLLDKDKGRIDIDQNL